MNFAAWKRDILARAPASRYPDPRPIPHDMRYTADDVRFLRTLRIVMPAPMGSLLPL